MTVRPSTRTRSGQSLSAASREFWRHPSPWLIAATLIGSLAARVLGDWQVADALVPVLVLAAFPFVEWVIHVCLLHWRPRRLAGFTVDPLISRKHREHHVNPRDIPLIFIPWQVLVWLLPALVAIALFAFPRAGLGLTFLSTVAAVGMCYEWIHYLVHTDYKPRTAAYRAVWRNHRYHHFKNEHYWFTVTTSGTADRVLRTYPDPQRVLTSPTARNLYSLED